MLVNYERSYDSTVAGLRICAPMMKIHTVAAGGGSILHFDGLKYRVGPDSAGANPGPASYGNGGPLTITDCNLMLGKLQPEYFPQIFGIDGHQPLNLNLVEDKFSSLSQSIKEKTDDSRNPHDVADGFLKIAIDNMAHAIKKISVQRGYDITEYALCCFGGAGGQHACLIAEVLGIKTILIHPYAGVLSAYGIGLAPIRSMGEKSITKPLSQDSIGELEEIFQKLIRKTSNELHEQKVSPDKVNIQKYAHIRYKGTDSSIIIRYEDNILSLEKEFEEKHQRLFGFIMPDKTILIEAISVEATNELEVSPAPLTNSSVEPKRPTLPLEPERIVKTYNSGKFVSSGLYLREELQAGDKIEGPAIIIEDTGTTIVEKNWELSLSSYNHIILKQKKFKSHKEQPQALQNINSSTADPVMLEIFNNLFMSIAEQMGATLENTAYSVNIKERLDFSCTVFDSKGHLIANAPHMPVHLGSMSESVKVIIHNRKDSMQPGDSFMLNNPYNGGTHLPDITVVTPVFHQNTSEAQGQNSILFYVASRAHHADIGGVTPGSIPPHSQNIEEEGVLINDIQIVDQNRFLEEEVQRVLRQPPYPARNIKQNLADLRAQIASNKKGVHELKTMVKNFGISIVKAYMSYVQENAESAVKKVIGTLQGGHYKYEMDNGSFIEVNLSIDKKSQTAIVDFTGTSEQKLNNFNAPSSVVRAAVMYVFRTLVNENIPMNEGCLKPIQIIIPDGCMLKPSYPSAVVAGNVETSQYITDTLYGALGILSGSQGTMNNFTFGNESYQYYETICGGSGAGSNFHGCDAVQTHMTNTKLTDPEILESQFPVRINSFEIRTNSGGIGKFHGGNGAIRKICFLEPMQASILSGHRRIPPYGLQGGGAGAKGRNYVIRSNGETQALQSTDKVEMNTRRCFRY